MQVPRLRDDRGGFLKHYMEKSPESDPVKHLQELTKRADASINDDAVFDAAINELNEKLLAEELKRLDKLIGISEQYENQVALMRDVGILGKLPDGSEGIIGADGTAYPVPSLLSIVQRFCEDGKKYELLRKKVEQGFRTMQLVPFALRSSWIAAIYNAQLVEKHAKRELYCSDGTLLSHESFDPTSPSSVVKLSDDFIDPNLRYFPEELKEGSGLTQEEAIVRFGGWQVELIENLPLLPRRGQARNPVGGRPIIEAGMKPVEYMELLKFEPYKGEIGRTEKSWLMQALIRLKETGYVLNDEGNFRDSACMLLGVRVFLYFAERTSTARFQSDHGKVVISSMPATFNFDHYSTSTAVRI